MTGKRVVSPEDEKRIWGEEGFRVFLSHKSEVKKETAELKKRLKLFGVSCFVAHEDIEPTQAWQDEIENALSSMDALVALMTENFHDSNWTDQEVGFALGRRVPIVSLKLGKDPYGFIGKYQALSCTWKSAHREIVKILIKHDRMVDAYIETVEKCREYDEANMLAKILPRIDRLSENQANSLISAFNGNNNVSDSYGFNGKARLNFGEGLVFHLNRLMGKRYEFSDSGKIEAKP